MSGLTRETRGRRQGSASEAPTDERVGKRIGVGYNGDIWFLLYWAPQINVDFDDLQRLIVREIYSYVYSVPAGAFGDAWPEHKVQACIGQLRQSLVRPYAQSITRKDAPDQIVADPPISAEYVVVADDGESYLVFFDPESNEFGLAQRLAGRQPVTIGVRGNVVGVFMAR